jgi:hypothetical protein
MLVRTKMQCLCHVHSIFCYLPRRILKEGKLHFQIGNDLVMRLNGSDKRQVKNSKDGMKF